MSNSKEKEKVTPIPYGRVAIVFIMWTTDLLAMSSLLPYLPFLIQDLGVTGGDKRNIGFYAGLVASSYYLSQCFSAFFWGWVSDRIGRKPVLLTGLFLSCIATFAFGFSKTLWWALGSRFIYGAVNGNLGVMKSFLAESTDKTNQAKVFGVLGLSFGAGMVLGPLIGGLLSLPVQSYPYLFVKGSPLHSVKWFFEYFPFCLPNLTIFLMTLVAQILGFFYLEETNPMVLARRRKKKLMKEYEKMQELEEEVPEELEMKIENLEEKIETLEETANEEDDTNDDPYGKYPSAFQEILCTVPPLLICASYAIAGLGNNVFNEALPLWIVQDFKNGGLNMGVRDIGLIATLSGFFLCFFSLFIVPMIVQKVGSRKASIYGALAHVPILPLYPLLSYLSSKSWAPLRYFLVGCMILVRMASGQVTFTPVIIMVNNSVTPKNMGKINGIGQSLVAMTRTLGPSSAGFLFSLSTHVPYFPFNIYFVFILVAFIQILLASMLYLLPSSIDHPKIIETSSNPLLEEERLGQPKEDILTVPSSNQLYLNNEEDHDDENHILADESVLNAVNIELHTKEPYIPSDDEDALLELQSSPTSD